MSDFPTTIDLSYLIFDDRMKLSLDYNGRKEALFLTRRMTSLIMRELGKILSKHFGLEKETGPALQSFVAHHFGQSTDALRQKPKAKTKKSEGEDAPDETESTEQDDVDDQNIKARIESEGLGKRPLIEKPIIIVTVHIRSGKDGIILELVSDDEDSFKVTLLFQELHGFVDILYRKCLDAQWKLEDQIPWLKDAYLATKTTIDPKTLN